jgi:nitrogen fixation-related uncharacterized protein
MSDIELGSVASWIIAAVIGLGILWAVKGGMLKTQYLLGDVSIPMETIGILVFLLAIGLGGFYFVTDVLRKV